MEHFQCGYAAHELAADRVRDNLAFVRRLEKAFRGHRLYDHPLNLSLAEGKLGDAGRAHADVYEVDQLHRHAGVARGPRAGY